MALSVSSFTLCKSFAASSRFASTFLIEMIVRVFIMPVLFDVQIGSIDRELLVTLAHFSRAGILAIGTRDWIVPVLTCNGPVERVRVSLRVTVALDVGFFDAGVARSEQRAVKIDVVSWTTFSASKDVVRVIRHAVATITEIL